MPGPLVILHESSGQPGSCLEGLVSYAREIAKTEQASRMSEGELFVYLWNSPVVFDNGEGPTVGGCNPAQRSRIWPQDFNCWEATAHFVGWALAQHLEVELHLFDAYLGKLRHVFPAWRSVGSIENPEALVLQPPVSPRSGFQNLASLGMARTKDQGGRAQAWYNDLLGVVHFAGDKVLRVFGQGELADSLADYEGDDLPDWSRTKGQLAAKKKQDAEAAKKAAEDKKASVVTEKVIQSLQKDRADPSVSPPANGMLVEYLGGIRNYGPPIC